MHTPNSRPSRRSAVNQTESNVEQNQRSRPFRKSPWNVPLSVRNSDSPVNNAIDTPERMSQQDTNRQEAKDTEEPYNLSGIAWQASNDASPEACLEDATLATCSFLSSEMAGAILGEDWEGEGHVQQDQDGHFIEASGDSVSFGDYSRPAGMFFPWVSPSMMTDPSLAYQRRLSNLSFSASNVQGSTSVTDFDPPVSQNNEWMGRSIETLMLGYLAAAPVLALPEAEVSEQAVCKCAEEKCTRRTSVSSLDSKRSPHRAARRTSLSRGARFRRSSSNLSLTNENASSAGPNVLLSLLAREVSRLLTKTMESVLPSCTLIIIAFYCGR